MYIYRISQDSNNGYDTYDSAIVVAENEEEAKKIHPYYGIDCTPKEFSRRWCDEPKQVKVQLIGTASVVQSYAHVVLASFNAG